MIYKKVVQLTDKKLKIVFHHDGILPVKKYGGIERIVFWHMCELVRQGHEVVLLSHPDSDVSEYGIHHIPVGKLDEEKLPSLIPADADIIHLQYNHIPKIDIPTVVTLHGNGKVGETFPKNTVFLSQNHAANHGGEVFVYNGINLAEYPFSEKENNWENFLFLGKGSWSVKNLKGCIKACKKSKKKLHIVGGKTLLPHPLIFNYGSLGGADKLSVMSDCDAHLFPIRWPEPFGLAMIESMALGLPVIGSPYGSLPEIINKDVGIICHNLDELIAALKNKNTSFDSKAIRKYVEEKFSISIYTEKYVEIYQRVIGGEELHSTPPTFTKNSDAQGLLPF